MNIGFLGMGHMSQAIYHGFDRIPDHQCAFGYISKTSVYDGVKRYRGVDDLLNWSDVVFLGIKPQQIGTVLGETSTQQWIGKTVVSPVAGLSLNKLSSYTGDATTLIRIMPNLALTYGSSVTARYTSSNTDITKKIRRRLTSMGSVVDIQEDEFHDFSAIYGCGPAFLLRLLSSFEVGGEAFAKNSTEHRDHITLLITGTLDYLNANPDASIDDLISKVASRGGVTEAGLKKMKELNVGGMLRKVFDDASKRSKELSGA